MEGELPSQRITEGVIWKQLLFFFFPILLGSFFQQMYNTVDTIIVGRFVGTQALAAVGATSALLNLMNGFFIGLSTGATVLLSQFYGAKSKQGVQDALHTGVALSLLLGAVVMLAIIVTVINLLVDIIYAFVDPRIKAAYGFGNRKVKKAAAKGGAQA